MIFSKEKLPTEWTGVEGLQRFFRSNGRGHDVFANGKAAAPFFLVFFGDWFFLDGYIHKAGRADDIFQFFDRRSAAHSAGVHFRIVLHVIRQLLHDNDVADGDSSARFQDTEDFPVNTRFAW